MRDRLIIAMAKGEHVSVLVGQHINLGGKVTRFDDQSVTLTTPTMESTVRIDAIVAIRSETGEEPF